jgi:glutamine cyclotransferase
MSYFFSPLRGALKKAWVSSIKVVEPVILEQLPHDEKAFTQGLLYKDHKLYESTGLDGCSSIRRLDASSGKVEFIKNLPNHWGEGIAFGNDMIVQLTWKDNKAIIYSWPELYVVGEWSFTGEGWGLSSMPKGFVMTNGSSQLIFLDERFKVLRAENVKIRGLPHRWLNDLAYANGSLYINRLGDNNIYVVDPATGYVLRRIDCSNLVKIAMTVGEDVLNGIAYDELENEFFITGKRWPVLFRTMIPET